MCLEYVLQQQLLNQDIEKVILYGDNSISLKTITDADLKLTKNKDFFLEILHLRKEINGRVEAIYVKAHQDDVTDYEALPPHVQAHVRCDRRLKNFVSTTISHELLPKPLRFQQVLFSNSQGYLPLNPYSYLTSSVYLDYAQRRLGLSAEHLWRVDWYHFASCVKNLSDRDYVIFQKLLWRFNPTQSKKRIYDAEKDDKCPLCGTTDTPYHFL